MNELSAKAEGSFPGCRQFTSRRQRRLRGRLGWGCVVVNVGFLCVIAFFVFLWVVVAVRYLRMIVGVGVPEAPMLETGTAAALVMMGDVPVVVGVCNRLMRVRGRLAFAFGSLTDRLHHRLPFQATTSVAVSFGQM